MRFVVAIFLLLVSTAAQADARLKSLANFTVMGVKGELADCISFQKTANALYGLSAMEAYDKQLDRVYKCKSEGPGKIQKSVQKLRAALKAQNISEAPLKDFIMTYQKINGILGDTSNAEADQYEKILAIKGEAVSAELEW